MPYVVAQPCVDVKDKACVDECPVDCIYEGSRSLYINPNECVDCGACEPVCPTEAIFYEDDLPDEWAWYKDAAVSFFATATSSISFMALPAKTYATDWGVFLSAPAPAPARGPGGPPAAGRTPGRRSEGR